MRKLKLDELGRKSVSEYKDSEKHSIVVVLDNIRSKANVGAVFRNSDAFLVEKIYLCGYTPAPPDREISKVSLGAELSLDWEKHADVLEVVRNLKAEGYAIASLEQAEGSTSLEHYKWQNGDKLALVLGNEVLGVDQKVVDESDVCLEIPMFGTKHSFNVSVSAGIALYGLIIPPK